MTSSAAESARDYHFECSDRLSRSLCEQRIQTLRQIIARQGSTMPSGWTWTLVADSDWPALAQHYNLQHDFAFTHMGERRTVINVLIFERFGGHTWEWAVAHETAHVVCDLVNDRATDQVADILLKRRHLDVKSICPRPASASTQAD